jgi:hypothetical protein
MTQNVSKLELMQTLVDIENWTANVRHSVELLGSDIPMVVDVPMSLPAVPEADSVTPADGDPEIACPLVDREDLGYNGVSPAPRPICATQANGSCFLGPRAYAEVRVKHLYRAMRSIEILAGICREVLGDIENQEMVVRPNLPTEGN